VALGMAHRRRLVALTASIIVSLSGAAVLSGSASAENWVNLGVTDVEDPEVSDLISRTHTVDSDDARMSSSFVVNGVLVDDNGAPVGGKQLQADLQPGPALLEPSAEDEDAEAVASIPLGRVLTNPSGEYKLTIPALENISGYLDEDGLAELLFSSTSDDLVMFYNVQAELPKKQGLPPVVPRGDKWVIGGDKKPFNRPLGAVNSQLMAEAEAEAPIEATPLNNLVLTAAHSDTTSQAAGPTKSSNGVAAGVGGGEQWCLESKQTHVYKWKWTSKGKGTVDTPIQGLVTLGKTKVEYEWQNTKKTEVTVGFDVEYKGVTATSLRGCTAV
jgi:hypothetical protein